MTENETESKSVAQAEQSKKTGWWGRLSRPKKILLVVAVFIIGVFIIASVATGGATKTSDEFVDKLLKGNSNSAYSMLSSEAQTTISQDDFSKVVTKMDGVLDDSASQKSKSVEGETGSAAKGTVTYEIRGSDGRYVLTINLIKEDGKWKVLNFENTLKK